MTTVTTVGYGDITAHSAVEQVSCPANSTLLPVQEPRLRRPADSTACYPVLSIVLFAAHCELHVAACSITPSAAHSRVYIAVQELEQAGVSPGLAVRHGVSDCP